MHRHRIALAAMVILTLIALAPTASAHDFDRANFHPLRYMAYPFHAVGVYVEYTVVRPIHWLVSQPNFDKIFGHEASVDDNPWEWRITG